MSLKAALRKLICVVVLTLLAVVAVAQIPSDALPVTTVYIVRYGARLYHRHRCPIIGKNGTAVMLMTAKSRGYSPCARCKPPAW
jgi:hypothetical protein